jgi:peptide/nickel transport system permease protein
VCDRVAVMKNGEIVEQGATDQLLRDPQHDYTKRLIACVPELGEGHAFLDRVRPLFMEART